MTDSPKPPTLLSRLTSAFSSANVSQAATPASSAPASGRSTPALGGGSAAPIRRGPLPTLDAEAEKLLGAAGVELIDCKACPAPCEDGKSDESLDVEVDQRTLRAWAKQDIDMELPMLGANAPFLHHCLVSSEGARDWVRDVSEIDGGLPQMLGKVMVPPVVQVEQDETTKGAEQPKLPIGCWQTQGASRPRRQLITASSAHSPSDAPDQQSIMLFPDWLLLSDIPSAEEDSSDARQTKQERVQLAYDAWIAPGAPINDARSRIAEMEAPGVPRMRRWVLPYRAVVLLCSHKKRDVRCHLAAPLLAQGLRSAAEKAGWHVDERGDTVGCAPSSSSATGKAADGTPTRRGFGFVEEEDEAVAEQQIKAWRRRAARGAEGSSHMNSDETGTLGIFYCSHIGGHKYSGNCIVYFPNGAGVWYGRVDPLRDSSMIFEQTIQQGKIISPFLRAGINLWRGPADGQKESEGQHVSGTAVEMKGAQGPGVLRW